MRIMKTVFLIAAAAALLFTPAIAAPVAYTVSSEGRPVLTLRLPNGCEAKTEGNRTIISDQHQKPKFEFELWVVENGKTVNEAVESVGKIIKTVFLDMKVTKTDTITVAGVPARIVSGAGAEADDDDPGEAEVVVFSMGGRVFAASVHGEGDYASEHRGPMLDVLNSARKP